MTETFSGSTEYWYMAKPKSELKISGLGKFGYVMVNVIHHGIDFGEALISPNKLKSFNKGEGIRITEHELMTPAFTVSFKS